MSCQLSLPSGHLWDPRRKMCFPHDSIQNFEINLKAISENLNRYRWQPIEIIFAIALFKISMRFSFAHLIFSLSTRIAPPRLGYNPSHLTISCSLKAAVLTPVGRSSKDLVSMRTTHVLSIRPCTKRFLSLQISYGLKVHAPEAKRSKP
jgi:hypothetical protein